MSTVEDLYKHYEVLDSAGASVSKHEDSYKSLLAACKAGDGQKKLAPSFISKFFKHFPKLADQAIDTLLDLCEEDDPNIRKLSIKGLPRLCQDMPDQVSRIADVLTQLLQTEEQSELKIVQEALLSLFKLDVKGSLAGVFSQILQGVDTSREQAIKFLQHHVGPLIPQLLHNNEEAEQYFLQETKRVLAEDVTGEEFQVFTSLLPRLKIMSSVTAIEEMSEMVASQAGLTEEFQVEDNDRVHKLISCMKSAIPFFQKGASVSTALLYMCTSVLPVFDKVTDKGDVQLNVLQLVAEMSACQPPEETASVCSPPVYDLLMVYCPPAPEVKDNKTEEPNLQFSFVECLLFAFHQLCKVDGSFLSGEEGTERLKAIKQRLQYFSRRCQSYISQLRTTLRGKSATQLKETENQVKVVALRTTTNISSIIKDFFRSPPSLKSSVILSWINKVFASSSFMEVLL
jgi:hypothetical protein